MDVYRTVNVKVKLKGVWLVVLLQSTHVCTRFWYTGIHLYYTGCTPYTQIFVFGKLGAGWTVLLVIVTTRLFDGCLIAARKSYRVASGSCGAR